MHECVMFSRLLPLLKLKEFQTIMAEPGEFENVDADADPGDEENKAAKAIWVRVANSTGYAMEVETFTNRAHRQEVKGI